MSNLSEKELKYRKEKWKPRATEYTSGTLVEIFTICWTSF